MLEYRNDIQHSLDTWWTGFGDMVLDSRRGDVLYSWYVLLLLPLQGTMVHEERGPILYIPLLSNQLSDINVHRIVGASIAEIVSAFPTCGGL